MHYRKNQLNEKLFSIRKLPSDGLAFNAGTFELFRIKPGVSARETEREREREKSTPWVHHCLNDILSSRFVPV